MARRPRKPRKPRRTALEDAIRAAIRPKRVRKKREGPSKHEVKFALLWKALGGPEIEAEKAGLVPGRKFRVDFVHMPSKVAIELHGGTFMPFGRHTYGEGFRQDRIKRDLLEDGGFKVFELTERDIEDAMLLKIMAKIRERLANAHGDSVSGS